MFINKREVKISIPTSSKQSNFLTIKSQEKQGLSKPIRKVTFWQKIKTWLFPRLKESERLTLEYFEAEIHKRQSEADKIAAQTEVLKQKEVFEFNKIINEIFKDDGLPKSAKYLKLAKVLEKNSQVLENFKDVKKITENIKLDEQQRIKLND
jgi:hypothetical protein